METTVLSDSQLTIDFIHLKREFYGDVLKDNCFKWKMMRYPLDDFKPVLYAFIRWIYEEPIAILESIVEKCDSNCAVFDDILLSAVEVFKVIADSSDLLHSNPPDKVLNNALLCLKWILNSVLVISSVWTRKNIGSNSSYDAKIIALFEAVIKLLQSTFVMVSHNVDNLIDNYNWNVTISHFEQFSSLAVETGMVLLEYTGASCNSSHGSSMGAKTALLISLCRDYVASISGIAGLHHDKSFIQ